MLYDSLEVATGWRTIHLGFLELAYLLGIQVIQSRDRILLSSYRTLTPKGILLNMPLGFWKANFHGSFVVSPLMIPKMTDKHGNLLTI